MRRINITSMISRARRRLSWRNRRVKLILRRKTGLRLWERFLSCEGFCRFLNLIGTRRVTNNRSSTMRCDRDRVAVFNVTYTGPTSRQGNCSISCSSNRRDTRQATNIRLNSLVSILHRNSTRYTMERIRTNVSRRRSTMNCYRVSGLNNLTPFQVYPRDRCRCRYHSEDSRRRP